MTDSELRDAAVAALKRTTISYPEWEKRRVRGYYPDVTRTEWWKAFDALGRIGVAAPPPPPAFTCGAKVPQPWPEPTRTVTTVTDWPTLSAALAKGGSIRVRGHIVVPPTVVNATIGVPNTTLWGDWRQGDRIEGRVLVQAGYARIQGLEVFGSLYDAVKIADGKPVAFVDIVDCWLHDVGDQGVLSAFSTSSDIWVRGCLIERVGLTSNPGVQADGHCVYTGGPTSRWTIINNVLRPKAFGVQLSPQPRDILVAGNTIYGGDTRGGIVFSGAANVRVVGNIIANSATAAFENWGVTGAAVSDLVWWDCPGGLNTAGLTPVQVVNALPADPLFADAAADDFRLQTSSPALNMVRDLDWLPDTFLGGKKRDRAAAGACEAL